MKRIDIMLISLRQWSINRGKNPDYGRIAHSRGKLPMAVKIGRNYLIEPGTPLPSDRRGLHAPEEVDMIDYYDLYD